MKVFGVTGWKNSGKTGLMERLVAECTARGLSVSTLKHAHHNFDLDQEGRDSYRHRAAGAKEVAIISANRWAIQHELKGAPEPDPEDILAKMADVDLVLIEGFKSWTQRKIFCYRAETGGLDMTGIDAVAVASDTEIAGLSLPRFDLDDTKGIADFILRDVGLA
ncbi:MAG: molybdopterin-guanine dinucleotide biosynthesis protein B [Pseudomonadota bacterium]